MTELEGLCRCSRLGEAARNALSWVGGACTRGVRLVTARGSLLNSRTFTAENHKAGHSNDDRVLDTAINLQANLTSEQGESFKIFFLVYLIFFMNEYVCDPFVNLGI